MKEFRCTNQHCGQLLFKYKLEGDILLIEVKCYACNEFSTFRICLNRIQHKLEQRNIAHNRK